MEKANWCSVRIMLIVGVTVSIFWYWFVLEKAIKWLLFKQNDDNRLMKTDVSLYQNS